jgi:transposase InsO family protein
LVIAFEDDDSDAFRPHKKLGTDPTLTLPDEGPLPEDVVRRLDKHNANEPSLTNTQKVTLLQILEEHSAAFAAGSWDIGACKVEPHRIDTGDALPVNTPPHNMPYHLRPVLRKELDELLEHEIVEPSTSAWASPIVYVKKKDSTWRLCVDFRKLNKVARSCAYPLPKINDILSTMRGSRYFSTLDLNKGFWQIKLAEESKGKTSFTTVFGQFQFKRLPFGLATSPGAFQSAMNSVLAGINWVNGMVYIDDILIFTETFEEHLEVLAKVLKRLIAADLRVKLPKCEFARTQCQYLGHVLNSQGVMPNPEKVKAVAEMPYPTCIQQVETFLGKVVYYGKFIDHMATIARPLNNLKKKKAQWKFDDEEKEAFDLLKKRLCSAPVLRHPDLSKPFILSTDASGYGIGAVLSQEFEDGEHPISYASVTLQDEQTRYSTIEREAVALCWGIIHFEEYLLYKPFIAYTDHKPLLSLKAKDQANKKLQGFAIKLQHFDFDIRYRKGADNANADALSRAPRYPFDPVKGKRTRDAQAEQNEEGAWMESPGPSVPKGKAVDSAGPVSAPQVLVLQRIEAMGMRSRVADQWARLLELQRRDPDFAEPLEFLETGLLPEDRIRAAIVRKLCEKMVLNRDGLLCRTVGPHRPVCIPEVLRPTMLARAHDAAHAAHGGMAKTYARLVETSWWPGLRRDSNEYVANCPLCAAHKPPPRQARAPLGGLPPPRDVFDRVHMDVWSACGTSADGNTGVIAFVDVLSKFVIAKAIPNHQTPTLVDAFMTSVAAVYGMPSELISDGAREFRSKLQSQIFRAAGVVRRIVTPYHPQANGQVERFFRTFRPMLAAMTHRNPRRWDRMLPHIVHSYNTSYSAVIQNTPFFLMFGRDAAGGELVLGSDEEEGDPASRRLRAMRSARRWARRLILHEQRKNQALYDRKAKEPGYSVGDAVYVKIRKPVGPVRKLIPKYTGPYRIRYIRGTVMWVVPIGFPHEPERQVHADRVRPANGVRHKPVTLAELNMPWNVPADVDPNLDREVETLRRD